MIITIQIPKSNLEFRIYTDLDRVVLIPQNGYGIQTGTINQFINALENEKNRRNETSNH